MLEERPITWASFREAFSNHFFPNALYIKKIVEFNNLTEDPNMLVVEYSVKFLTLGKYSPMVMTNLQLKMH